MTKEEWLYICLSLDIFDCNIFNRHQLTEETRNFLDKYRDGSKFVDLINKIKTTIFLESH